MFELDRLSLAIQTRDENGADSNDRIRLFSGVNEVAQFPQSIPTRGKCGLLETSVSLIYEDLVSSEIHLGLTGSDRWAPRAAFLWGRVNSSLPGAKIVPIAHNLWATPKNTWVTQNITEGVDRWRIFPFSHLSLLPDAVSSLVLFIETKGFQIFKDYPKIDHALLNQAIKDYLPTIGANVDEKNFARIEKALTQVEFKEPMELYGNLGSEGPLDFSVYSYASPSDHVHGFNENALSVSGSSVNELDNPITSSISYSLAAIFHSELSTIGLQAPAKMGGHYLAPFALPFIVRFAQHLIEARIRVKTDDSWWPSRVYLFGLGGYNRSRLISSYEDGNQWFSQNPEDGSQFLRLRHDWSVLDN